MVGTLPNCGTGEKKGGEGEKKGVRPCVLLQLKWDKPSARISYNQGHRIKIGELGRMANPAFGENLSFCGTSSHLFTMFAVALVITNKYTLHVQ
jgi:hypothetical protein